jgi:hypothetical protein
MTDTSPASLSPGAARARRYRERKTKGERYVRIRVNDPIIQALVKGGTLGHHVIPSQNGGNLPC